MPLSRSTLHMSLSLTRSAGLVTGAGWCGWMCCVLTILIESCMCASSLPLPMRLSWVQGVIFMYFPESRKRFVNANELRSNVTLLT